MSINIMKLTIPNLIIHLAAFCALPPFAHAAEKFIWSEGHGDLAVDYVTGTWQWHVEEGKEVDQVIIRLNDVARKEIPDNPSFSFLGIAGAPIWIIPAAETAGIPFLGINAQATPAGTFVNGRFVLFLGSVSGTGDFIMWTTSGTGTVAIQMNSRDGIANADKTDVPAGGHFHQNWGFTSPGTYRVGFKASGVLSGQTTPTNSDEEVYTFEANVLKSGEADIEVAYEEGALEFHIHDEAADVEFDPAHVALQAGPATWQTVPASPAFSFLGSPGASIYVLPQEEIEKVLALGLAAAEVSVGTFTNDELSIKLVSVEGPGEFAYYEIDQFGTPIVSFNTADGISATDMVTVMAGSHAHRNWSFSQPGVYRVTLQASGTLVGGGDISSPPSTFLFEVLPPAFLDEGEIDFEVAFDAGQWELGLLDEVAGREFNTDEAVLVLRPAARQSVPNDPAFSFLGTAGAPVYVLPQDETEGLLFVGIAGDEIPAGLFTNETVKLELVSASGPGNFSLYIIDGFGDPTVFMNTANGISAEDAFPVAIGSHTHSNWAFSAPGEYHFTFKASGTLLAGNQFTESDTVTLAFLVQDQPSGPLLKVSLLTKPRQLQIEWDSRTGVSYQLSSLTNLTSGTWTNEGTPIAGIDGKQTTTVDVGPEGLKLFRLAEIHP